MNHLGLRENNMRSIFSLFKNKKIGLALGGGAAWGIAHIGVFKAIEEFKIPIYCISGTSAGSIAGALYAAGLTASQIEKIALSTHWSTLVKPSIPIKGIFSTEPMEDFLKKYLINTNIQDLNMPFSAVAVDAIEGKEIIFKEGYIPTAVRASCAVPGIFRPVEQGNMMLIDGGVMDNVPVTPVKDLGCDLVIAVHLTPEFNTWKPKNTAELILKSFLIAQYANSKREMSKADVALDINTKKISPTDLKNTKELIDLGYETAIKVFEKEFKKN